MLEDAKVIISLEDLDELRLKEKHYTQLIRDISKCIIFNFDDYKKELKKADERINSLTDDFEIDKAIMDAEKHARSLAKILINTTMLEKILLNNCELNKTEDEMAIFETLSDPKVIYMGGGVS